MKVSIYQINMDRDSDRVCFLAYNNLEKFQGSQMINSCIYDKVFSGEVHAKTLEDVYRIFNIEQPENYKGRSMSVSDIVQIENSTEVEDGCYYCDDIGFKPVEFETDKAKEVNEIMEKNNESDMTLEEIMEEYPVGTTIELINMEGEDHMIPGIKGEVVGIDDLGQIHMQWENGSTLALNTDVDSFKKVDKADTISVLLVQADKYPKMIEIEDSLESMQTIVGGMIEEYMPFEDEVALICNEEGKINGLPLNRAVYGPDGEVVDIVAGDFFLAYAPIESERFLSMPDKLTEKYRDQFKYPERFLSTEKGIIPVPYKPVNKERGR